MKDEENYYINIKKNSNNKIDSKVFENFDTLHECEDAGASPPLSTRPRKHTHVMLRFPPYLSRVPAASVVWPEENKIRIQK